jgi:hypothetical protein
MKSIRLILSIAVITASLNFCRGQTSAASADGLTGTLAYHLATNAVGYARGRSGSYDDTFELSNWVYAVYSKSNLACLTNAVWSTRFWLHGVKGLSATSIGLKDGMGGQGMVTMVSPRHYLFATHMHPEGYNMVFLATNNVIQWRTTLERLDLDGDVSLGIINADLPPSVGYLPVLPADYTNYLSAKPDSVIQGIGMNQQMRVFGEPMNFSRSGLVLWDSHIAVPSGLGTNWNFTLGGGDSSNPAMLLINNQLVLVSHNYFVQGGPNYASRIDAINRAMHHLSTGHHLRTDYQLTAFSLKNWQTINH